MENFNQISIFLTQSARDSVNCRFENNEKLRELLRGNSQFANVILNGPIDMEEFIKWKANVYSILESMGACNINIASDAYEKNSYDVGAKDKIVSASLSIEYRMKYKQSFFL
jgi:heme oxygenase